MLRRKVEIIDSTLIPASFENRSLSHQKMNPFRFIFLFVSTSRMILYGELHFFSPDIFATAMSFDFANNQHPISFGPRSPNPTVHSLSNMKRGVYPLALFRGKLSSSMITRTHQRIDRGCAINLYSKKEDENDNDPENDDDGKMENVSVSLGDESAEKDVSVLSGNRRENNPVSDFLYGANYVNSHYLAIVWKYSIVRSLALTLPVGIAVWMDEEYGIYDTLFRGLRSVLVVSSATARLLQLPLEIIQSLLIQCWNVSPEAMATAIGFLPHAIAIPVVQFALSIHTAVMALVTIGRGNPILTFLSSMIAIVLWRPAVEEWQYRSVLDKLLFATPRWFLGRWNRQMFWSKEVLVSSDSTTDNEEEEESIECISASDLPPIAEPQKSSRWSFGGVRSLFGRSTERPDEDNKSNDDLESSSSMKSDCEPLSSTNNKAESANTTNDDEGIVSLDNNMYTPFLPDESTRILLGSLLFATTRLGWLAADPADTVALSNSPYGFTIGFIQSILALFSSSQAMPDIRHGLRIFILLLAIHQTVSTFLVAQHVFAGIYRQRGLAASVGAHVSWTVGKGTIAFRLLWKFWQWSAGGIWSVSWGSAGVNDTSSIDSDSA